MNSKRLKTDYLFATRPHDSNFIHIPADNPLDVFLSYSHKDKEIANDIDSNFARISINIIRDERDTKYRDDFKEFMEEVAKHPFVLMIISDEYLKSKYCMYEVSELINTHQFKDRIVPVILDNARSIFQPEGRKAYYEYWKHELDQAKKTLNDHQNTDFAREVKMLTSINNNIDEFFGIIQFIKIPPHSELKLAHYDPILEIFKQNDEYKAAIELAVLHPIADLQEKELALEKFLQKYSKNLQGLYTKAAFTVDRGLLKKAKIYYQEFLDLYPKYAPAHHDLAYILWNNDRDGESALKHYQTALELLPDFGLAMVNLGILYIGYDLVPDRFDKARSVFIKAIKLQDDRSRLPVIGISDYKVLAHCNLAVVLEARFSRHSAAERHFMEAIALDPQFAIGHFNYAIFLYNVLQSLQKAKAHYIIAFNLWPQLANPEMDSVFGIKE